MWTRKRTIIAGKDDGDLDWIVLYQGEVVGRVYATKISDPDRAWQWFAQVQPVGQGFATTLEDALERLRAHYEGGGGSLITQSSSVHSPRCHIYKLSSA
ncbi:hypothetical protein GCM10011415_27900 [Salipiger pallidus]|uniref:Uncharacterized protein n=1 Tax=Salipiger pallidus TaxID=1775170 RepID=A0A8J2ZLK9_9RHOB|nr:hypothetical protein [Salipiger pallidus]GGG77418.1 hypothetical protein GCM10011415_27900 [Salipiger pallidus]